MTGDTLIGQWLAEVRESDEDPVASLRIDLEERGAGCFGHAYLFYPGAQLPGFLYAVSLPKEPPYQTTVRPVYLYPGGGVMTQTERDQLEALLTEQYAAPPPVKLDVEFLLEGKNLKINWSAGDERAGSIVLTKSDATGPSSLKSRPDLTSWDEFRQWAVSQRPRNYIFRGQKNPHKLVSSFHRTWRKDLRAWIAEDVTTLFGAMAERLNYPLQMGNLQHNAAIWSILQHHGYPTPLIDWTYSPFVAAYFAFQDADQSETCAPRIYMFDRARWNERYGKVEFIVDAAPDQLVVLESMPAANPRHTPQQAISIVTNVADVEGYIRRKEQ